MTEMPALVDLDPANIETLPCCGVKNADHEGRCNKIRWLQAQFKKGLRAKMLLTPASGSVATSSTSPVSMPGAASMPAATCSFTASGPSTSSISTGVSALR